MSQQFLYSGPMALLRRDGERRGPLGAAGVHRGAVGQEQAYDAGVALGGGRGD